MNKINKRLVYASISGFGQDGPYRDRPGFDQIAQGMGGLMSITGEPGRGPVRVGIPVADLTAGIFAAMGILIALLERETSGEGQWVTSSLLGAQIAMLDFQAARWTIAHEVPGQAGNNHPTSIPTGVFATSDGHINIAAAGNDIYHRCCRALGVPELATDPRPCSLTGNPRLENRDTLNETIEAITHIENLPPRGSKSSTPRACPAVRIYKMNEVFDATPQVKHLGIARKVFVTTLSAISRSSARRSNWSRTPWSVRSATPEAGEHTI